MKINGRYFYLDAWRGTAIVLMLFFHFTFDLSQFGFVSIDFNREPFWLNFRSLIVTFFLGLVGISLQLATEKGINPRRYGSRLLSLIIAALMVNAGSYWVFPEKMILFGILHFIALASVLGLFFRRLYWSNLLLGTAFIAFEMSYSHAWFHSIAWYGTGLMAFRPASVDYVPLFPWFGVVLIGMFLARFITRQRLITQLTPRKNKLTLLLAWGGRHSLLIYLLHQPLFFALFYLHAFFTD